MSLKSDLHSVKFWKIQHTGRFENLSLFTSYEHLDVTIWAGLGVDVADLGLLRPSILSHWVARRGCKFGL